jgi:hypothetical protein
MSRGPKRESTRPLLLSSNASLVGPSKDGETASVLRSWLRTSVERQQIKTCELNFFSQCCSVFTF